MARKVRTVRHVGAPALDAEGLEPGGRAELVTTFKQVQGMPCKVLGNLARMTEAGRARFYAAFYTELLFCGNAAPAIGDQAGE